MADKSIGELVEASEIFSNDWFVVEQNEQAKKLNGDTMKQYLSTIQLNKIERVTFDSNGACHIFLSDGREIVSQSLFGPKGETGDQGIQGPIGPQGETGDPAPTITNMLIDSRYHLIITLSDGSSYDAGYCRGASGSGTGDMISDDYDPDGSVISAGGIPNYVEEHGGGNSLPLTGGTMAGTIDMDNNSITGILDPANDTDAVNKEYVDNAISRMTVTQVYEAEWEIDPDSDDPRIIEFNIPEYFEADGVSNVLKIKFVGPRDTYEYEANIISIVSDAGTFVHNVKSNRINPFDFTIIAPTNTVSFQLKENEWHIVDGFLPEYTNPSDYTIERFKTFEKAFPNLTGFRASEVWRVDANTVLVYTKASVSSASSRVFCAYSVGDSYFQLSDTEIPGYMSCASNPVKIGNAIHVFLTNKSMEGTGETWEICLATSNDSGKTWSIGSTIYEDIADWPNGYAHYNGDVLLFVSKNDCFYSNDLTIWNHYTIPSSGYTHLTQANGYFCLTNPTTSSSYIFVSQTGLPSSWSQVSMGRSLIWTGLCGVQRNADPVHYVVFGCSANNLSATAYAYHTTDLFSGFQGQQLDGTGYTHLCFSYDDIAESKTAYSFIGERYFTSIYFTSSGDIRISSYDIFKTFDNSKTTKPNNIGFNIDRSFLIFSATNTSVSIKYDELNYVFDLKLPDGTPMSLNKTLEGSYIGTGTYGSDNSHILDFPFIPKMVIVVPRSTSGSYPYIAVMIHGNDTCNVDMGDSSSSVWDVSWNDSDFEVEWYARSGTRSAIAEMNESDSTYYYIGIG